MKTMTAEELKEALLNNVTFTEPIRITNNLSFYSAYESFYTASKKIKSLPDNIEVNNLNLYNSEITLLPNYLRVNELYLNFSKIEHLPDTLLVNKLNLDYSIIEYLPDTLSVNYLYLGNSKVTLLPQNLSVKYLNISHSKIKNIPTTIKNLEEIIVDSNFLFSIPYDSFSICVLLFKDIITIKNYPNNLVTQQFEQRLQQGK